MDDIIGRICLGFGSFSSDLDMVSGATMRYGSATG